MEKKNIYWNLVKLIKYKIKTNKIEKKKKKNKKNKKKKKK